MFDKSKSEKESSNIISILKGKFCSVNNNVGFIIYSGSNIFFYGII